MSRITQPSLAHSTLKRATKVNVRPKRSANKWVMVCDRSEASILRSIAQKKCPEALSEIEKAFRLVQFHRL